MTPSHRRCRPGLFAAAFLLVAGCASMDEDRWRIINEDGVLLFSKGKYNEALQHAPNWAELKQAAAAAQRAG